MKKAILVCVFGAAFCAVLTVFPDFVAAVFAPDGMIWSPVNSLQFRYNDSYYQVPWVRAITAGTLLPVTPSNIDNSGIGFEAVRIVPFWISSLPGLIFSDVRFIIVASFILTASTIYAVSFAIARQFTSGIAIAASAGIASYFFQALWAYLPVEVWAGPVNGISYLTPYGLRLPWLIDITDTAMINSNLRFVSIAASVPILLLHYLACLRIARSGGWPWLAVMSVTLIALPFSYPTHAFMAFMIAGCYALLAVIARDRRSFVRFAGPVILAGMFLLAVDYPALLKASRESSPIYMEVMRVGTGNLPDLFKTDTPAREIWLTLVFNKYNLAAALLVIIWPRARRDILALYLATIPVIAIHVGSLDYFILRALFAQRGADVIWVVVIFSITAAAIVRLFGAVSLDRFAAAAIAVAVFGLPAVSFARYALRIATTDAIRPFLIPRGDWDAYVWLGTQSPPDVEIMASSWGDVELLPMLYPVNMFYANNSLQQRTLSEMMKRYVAAQKFLGMDRARFEELLDSTFRIWLSKADSVNARSSQMRYPIHSDSDFAAAHFAFTILYWPYVRKLEGVTYSSADMKSPTPEFKAKALAIFDDTDARATICNSKVARIVVRASEAEAIHLTRLFKTSTLEVYSFDRSNCS